MIELPLGLYLRRSVGIPALAAVAMLVAAAARWLCDPLPPWARLSITTVALVGVFFILLAYIEGISPRSVMKAVKGEEGQAGENQLAPATDLANDEDRSGSQRGRE